MSKKKIIRLNELKVGQLFRFTDEDVIRKVVESDGCKTCPPVDGNSKVSKTMGFDADVELIEDYKAPSTDLLVGEYIEKPEYTHKQMIEMISRTRSWTLNKPSGGLPFLPMGWVDCVSQEDNEKATRETLPPYKKTHRILRFLMFIKVL